MGKIFPYVGCGCKLGVNVTISRDADESELPPDYEMCVGVGWWQCGDHTEWSPHVSASQKI